MITFCKALDATMKAYGIKGVWIAEKAGVSNQTVSNFLIGKGQIKSESLERILNALPSEAQEYFFQQMHPIGKDLRSLVLRASDDEKAEILRLIAASLSSGIVADRLDAMAV